MTKNEFRKHVIVSSLLTAIVIAIIIVFCVIMLDIHSKPSDENTYMASGTVADVYNGGRRMGVVVKMSNGERLQLVYPNFSNELYSYIGYDLDELSNLLEGKNIEYRRMSKLPWVIEIYVNDAVVDNNKLTVKEIVASRICIVIIGLILLAFPICGEAAYIKSKRKIYRKAEKKRIRRAKRNGNNS